LVNLRWFCNRLVTLGTWGENPADWSTRKAVAMVAEFRLLGDVEVCIDGRVIDVGHARQRCVLVALMVEANRTVSVDALVERVWADHQPSGLGARCTAMCPGYGRRWLLPLMSDRATIERLRRGG
jgi:hypothetical protein